MKKFYAFTLSMLTAAVTLSSTALASGPDETDIKLQQINPTTRSLMDTPEASIKQDILSISFDASGICSFYKRTASESLSILEHSRQTERSTAMTLLASGRVYSASL